MGPKDDQYYWGGVQSFAYIIYGWFLGRQAGQELGGVCQRDDGCHGQPHSHGDDVGVVALPELVPVLGHVLLKEDGDGKSDS